MNLNELMTELLQDELVQVVMLHKEVECHDDEANSHKV